MYQQPFLTTGSQHPSLQRTSLMSTRNFTDPRRAG